MTVMVEGLVEKPKQETWRKRISLKKCFILYKTLAIIIGLSALSALIYVIYNKNLQPIHIQVEETQVLQEIVEKPEPEYVCNSDECKQASSRILKYMDKNKEPCENFYDFACGNFAENINIPDKNKIDSSLPLNEYLHEQFIKMVEKPIQYNEPRPFQLVKKLYSTCMNEERIEEEGLRTMKNILKNLGGWPVLHGDSWVEDNFNLEECDYRIRKLGYDSYFITFKVYDDYKLSIRRFILNKPSSINYAADDYFKYMVDIAELFGADRNTAESELKQSFDFEQELQNFPDDPPNFSNLMTIKQLETNFPNLPWMEGINKLLAPDNQVTEDEIIIVASPNYIAHFEDIISRTPMRVLANYVMWRVVADSIDSLNDVLRKRQLDYYSACGFGIVSSRSENCLERTRYRLDIASSAMYVYNYFNGKSKQTVTQMVSDISSEFYEILKNVDWMDEQTRKYALEKAADMTFQIGYPDELADKTILEEYYKDLKLDTDDYLLSALKIKAFDTRLSYKNIRQQLDEVGLKYYSHTVFHDAEYSFNNELALPAGSLQGIFFDVNRPAYMNYASIGFVVSRQMTYGFDENGKDFGKNGEPLKVSWWQNPTKCNYDNKVRCVMEQYREYYSARQNISEVVDSLSSYTIIPDIGGSKIAYLAYNKWAERNGLEPKLPGLDYTPQQMFWISAANALCTKYHSTPESQNEMEENLRAFAAFSISEQFANDFKCVANTPMNPSKTCNVW